MFGLEALMFNKFPLLSTTTFPRKSDAFTESARSNTLFRNRENYIHRIGRSGRFGRKGVAINVRTYLLFISRRA